MQSDFWLERWEQNQIGFHEEQVNHYLKDFLVTLNLIPKSKIFVPLCGKSKDMIWLRSKGYQVLGVELSPIAVKSFFSENDLEPNITKRGAFQCWETDGLCIYLGDFFNLSHEDLAGCAAIYDRASLIALPLGMRRDYVEHLKTIAHAIKQTLLVTLEYDQNEMQGPPFSVNTYTVDHLFGKTCDIKCLAKENILEQDDHFSQRGLTRLIECVYLLNKS